MSEGFESITLLALAPSGETLMVRDRSGRIWLIRPPGAGPSQLVDVPVVERAIADHGFLRIEQDFENWETLEAYRQERAAEIMPGVAVSRHALDSEDVRRLLGVARRWITDDRGPQARALALELLRTNAARQDINLHEELVSFLADMNELRPDFVSEPATPLQASARQRWSESLAA